MRFAIRPPRAGRLAATAVAALLVVATVACAPPPRYVVPVGDARQLVVVTSSGWSSTSGRLSTYEKVGSTWRTVRSGLPVRLGRHGLNANHQEGDGTTPAGSFPIVGMMGGQANPGVRFPYHQLVPGDCWISNSALASYNTMVHASPCSPPNEDLYRIGAGAYRYAAITGYNMSPVVPGAGSAILLHRDSYDSAGRSVPTSGCVSMGETDLLSVLRWLDPAAHPRVAIGPSSWLVLP